MLRPVHFRHNGVCTPALPPSHCVILIKQPNLLELHFLVLWALAIDHSSYFTSIHLRFFLVHAFAYLTGTCNWACICFPFLSKSVEFRVGRSHHSRCGLTLQRRAGFFSLVLVARGRSQLRVLSTLMAIHCSANSGPALYQRIALPPLFMLAIIIILNSGLCPLAILVSLEIESNLIGCLPVGSHFILMLVGKSRNPH